MCQHYCVCYCLLSASNGTSDGLKQRTSSTDGASKPTTSAVKDKVKLM